MALTIDTPSRRAQFDSTACAVIALSRAFRGAGSKAERSADRSSPAASSRLETIVIAAMKLASPPWCAESYKRCSLHVAAPRPCIYL
jgi:hypothetical protein